MDHGRLSLVYAGDMLPATDRLPAEPVPRFMDTLQAGRYLNVKSEDPARTLKRYRGMGLKATQAGNTIVYKRDWLDEFMDQQAQRNPR